MNVIDYIGRLCDFGLPSQMMVRVMLTLCVGASKSSNSHFCKKEAKSFSQVTVQQAHSRIEWWCVLQAVTFNMAPITVGRSSQPWKLGGVESFLLSSPSLLSLLRYLEPLPSCCFQKTADPLALCVHQRWGCESTTWRPGLDRDCSETSALSIWLDVCNAIQWTENRWKSKESGFKIQKMRFKIERI